MSDLAPSPLDPPSSSTVAGTDLLLVDGPSPAVGPVAKKKRVSKRRLGATRGANLLVLLMDHRHEWEKQQAKSSGSSSARYSGMQASKIAKHSTANRPATQRALAQLVACGILTSTLKTYAGTRTIQFYMVSAAMFLRLTKGEGIVPIPPLGNSPRKRRKTKV